MKVNGREQRTGSAGRPVARCWERAGESHRCALPGDHRTDLHECAAGCCSWGSYTRRRVERWPWRRWSQWRVRADEVWPAPRSSVGLDVEMWGARTAALLDFGWRRLEVGRARWFPGSWQYGERLPRGAGLPVSRTAEPVVGYCVAPRGRPGRTRHWSLSDDGTHGLGDDARDVAVTLRGFLAEWARVEVLGSRPYPSRASLIHVDGSVFVLAGTPACPILVRWR